MDMDKLVALCKRRGFIFQSSEIYGGLNGFWDFGPLGVELKRNAKEAWWNDMVRAHDDLAQRDCARKSPRRYRADPAFLHFRPSQTQSDRLFYTICFTTASPNSLHFASRAPGIMRAKS